MNCGGGRLYQCDVFVSDIERSVQSTIVYQSFIIKNLKATLNIARFMGFFLVYFRTFFREFKKTI